MSNRIEITDFTDPGAGCLRQNPGGAASTIL